MIITDLWDQLRYYRVGSLGSDRAFEMHLFFSTLFSFLISLAGVIYSRFVRLAHRGASVVVAILCVTGFSIAFVYQFFKWEDQIQAVGDTLLFMFLTPVLPLTITAILLAPRRKRNEPEWFLRNADAIILLIIALYAAFVLRVGYNTIIGL